MMFSLDQLFFSFLVLNKMFLIYYIRDNVTIQYGQNCNLPLTTLYCLNNTFLLIKHKYLKKKTCFVISFFFLKQT